MGDQETKHARSTDTPEPATSNPADGRELSDEDLGKVAGGTGETVSAVSNVLKTRHDTAKNSISNVR